MSTFIQTSKVQAIQLTGTNQAEITDFLRGRFKQNGVVSLMPFLFDPADSLPKIGDWLLIDANGELFVCTQAYFNERFSPATEKA